MFIFFLITVSSIIGLNTLVKRAVDDYQYGGSYREWQEFEAMHRGR